MRVIEFSPERAMPITRFESNAASAVAVGSGSGEIRVNVVHFGPDSIIGPHPTGYCQLLLIVAGSGWAAAEDGERVDLSAGQGVFLGLGELHSKGSEAGMTAVMIQGTELDPPPDAWR
jgi:quercetin dioxygenase-like cupin family protein